MNSSLWWKCSNCYLVNFAHHPICITCGKVIGIYLTIKECIARGLRHID